MSGYQNPPNIASDVDDTEDEEVMRGGSDGLDDLDFLDSFEEEFEGPGGPDPKWREERATVKHVSRSDAPFFEQQMIETANHPMVHVTRITDEGLRETLGRMPPDAGEYTVAKRWGPGNYSLELRDGDNNVIAAEPARCRIPPDHEYFLKHRSTGADGAPPTSGVPEALLAHVQEQNNVVWERMNRQSQRQDEFTEKQLRARAELESERTALHAEQLENERRRGSEVLETFKSLTDEVAKERGSLTQQQIEAMREQHETARKMQSEQSASMIEMIKANQGEHQSLMQMTMQQMFMQMEAARERERRELQMAEERRRREEREFQEQRERRDRAFEAEQERKWRQHQLELARSQKGLGDTIKEVAAIGGTALAAARQLGINVDLGTLFNRSDDGKTGIADLLKTTIETGPKYLESLGSLAPLQQDVPALDMWDDEEDDEEDETEEQEQETPPEVDPRSKAAVEKIFAEPDEADLIKEGAAATRDLVRKVTGILANDKLGERTKDAQLSTALIRTFMRHGQAVTTFWGKTSLRNALVHLDPKPSAEVIEAIVAEAAKNTYSANMQGVDLE